MPSEHPDKSALITALAVIVVLALLLLGKISIFHAAILGIAIWMITKLIRPIDGDKHDSSS